MIFNPTPIMKNNFSPKMVATNVFVYYSLEKYKTKTQKTTVGHSKNQNVTAI